MKLKLLCLFLLLFQFSFSQSNISNGDFEAYTSLPINQSQVDRAVGWENVILSADYLNTTYNGWCSHYGGAFSGTGFMGFATYSGLTAAEAIGESINVSPLLADSIYEVGIYVKQSLDCIDFCGAVALYGFVSAPAINNLGIHADDLPGSILLWSSSTITDTLWRFYSGTFVPSDTINYILFTMKNIEDCVNYVYVDKASIQSIQSVINVEEVTPILPNVFSPNNDSQNDYIDFSNLDLVEEIVDIYNRWGNIVFQSSVTNTKWDGKDLKGNDCSEGVYYYVFHYAEFINKEIDRKGFIQLVR